MLLSLDLGFQLNPIQYDLEKDRIEMKCTYINPAFIRVVSAFASALSL